MAVVWKMSKVQEKCLVYSFIIVFNAIGVSLIAFFYGAPKGAQKKNEKERVFEICLVVMPLRLFLQVVKMAVGR